jgi:hypothetical protein
MVITQFGATYVSDLLKSTKVNPSEDNNAKYIQTLVSASVTLLGNNFGWQPFIFPGANMVMLNIPTSDSQSFQYVMNDITKAWSEFIGYQAHCWELHQQQAIFGAYGAVCRAWESTTDGGSLNPATGVIVQGASINAEAQTSFSYFDSMGTQKHFKMVRPTILSRGQFAINFAVNTDFVFDSVLAPASFAYQNPGRWDNGLWDEAIWAGGLGTYKSWQAVTGIGTAGSMRLLIRTSEETYWASTDWLYENGGIM